MLRRREVIGWSILALLIVWPPALWGADREVQEPKTPVARLEVRPEGIDWLPHVDYERLVLTVAGPGDLYIRQEFGAGQAPHFSLIDSKGAPLPDGPYAYELRVVPRLDPEVREKLARAQKTGDAAVSEELRKGGKLPEGLVQSGHLTVQGGNFMDPASAQPAPSTRREPAPKPPLRSFVAKDIVQPDDLVVQGHACIGPVCTAVAPGDPGLTLKEDFGGLLQIKFDADFCCYPTANDWALQAGDYNGPNGDFLIRNLSFNTIPFRIRGGAATPDNSLTVSINGNIGLGTLTPATQLHVFGTDANSRNKILVENAGSTNFRELLEIRNNGGAVFILKDMTVPQRWGQGTQGSSFVLDEQAHPGVEYVFTNTGNLTIAGTLTQGSSRNLKTDFASLDPKEVLARVSALPISLWSYKSENGVRHAGPVAEDFHQAFGLGADDKHIAPGDQAGIALLAVQGLNQILENKTQVIATLQRENADLTERVAALEALLSSLVKAKEPAAPAEPTPGPR